VGTCSNTASRSDTILFGIPFTNLSFCDVCSWVKERVASRSPSLIVTPNVDHVCRFQSDPRFREAYLRADLRLVDGTPIIWASYLLGSPLREKLSGSDLLPSLSSIAAREGFSIFLLGAAPGVAEEAAERLSRRFEGLKVAGTYSPPMGFYNDDQQNQETIQLVRESNPDIVFVAMGAPHQEIWMAGHYEEVGAPVMLGVGAAFNFAAGRVRRAPRLVQHAGGEWLWRLSLEPKRLWRRYLVDDMRFVPIVWEEWRSRRRAR
jgi:N-acetylglucosaminyldiphosphoundecaprenol N-acetyl-beta-D-mannosaminyltransferase